MPPKTDTPRERQCEILVIDEKKRAAWHMVSFIDIKKGEIFRLFDPPSPDAIETGEPSFAECDAYLNDLQLRLPSGIPYGTGIGEILSSSLDELPSSSTLLKIWTSDLTKDAHELDKVIEEEEKNREARLKELPPDKE